MQARENIVWMLRILCEESHASLVKIQRRKKIESSSICNCPHLVHAENHDHIASILQANSFLGAIQNVDFMDWHLQQIPSGLSSLIVSQAMLFIVPYFQEQGGMKSESTVFFYYGSGLPIPLEARLASFIVAFQKLVEIGCFFQWKAGRWEV